MVARFDDIFAAPNVVEKGSATLAHAPHFLPGPDGLIAVYGKGEQTWFFDGFVTVVHPFGAFAAVEVEHAQHDEPTRDLYIVRADSLPAPARLPGVVLAADIGAYQFTTRPPRFVQTDAGFALWYADDPAPTARVLAWWPAGVYAVVELEWSPFTDGAGETYTGERSILLCRRAALPG